MMKAWEKLQNIAQKLFPNAILTKGSGCVHHDGDTRNEEFIVECKQRKNDNFVLSLITINKLRKEALSRGLTPVWVMENGRKVRVVVMLMDDFKRLLEKE